MGNVYEYRVSTSRLETFKFISSKWNEKSTVSEWGLYGGNKY